MRTTIYWFVTIFLPLDELPVAVNAMLSRLEGASQTANVELAGSTETVRHLSQTVAAKLRCTLTFFAALGAELGWRNDPRCWLFANSLLIQFC
jgi:hypothetical protein